MPLSRRKFLAMTAGALCGSSLGAFGEALHEPHETEVNPVEIGLQRLPSGFEGLRIAQLSDIHFNSFMTSSYLERAVGVVNAQRPDVVVLTGDFVSASFSGREKKARAEHAWPCAEILRRIHAPLGLFAVLGNHDYDTNAEVVAEALRAGDRIRLLRNESVAIDRDGERLWFAGLDNVTRLRARPGMALQGIPREACTIVLVHEPDFADEIVKYSADLQISGHSHGGQIRFPFVGPLYLPPWAEKYPLGHYRVGNLQLYTNRGIGVIGLPMRFMCPPEITVFTLKRTPPLA